jgi:hypothetical protein
MSMDGVKRGGQPLVQQSKGLSRRGLLAGLGASGLATAAMIFGRTTDAEALYYYGCCRLKYDNNVDFGRCEAYGEYTWICQYGAQECYCCEWWAEGASAYHCA